MKDLLNFFLTHSRWFTFAFYAVVSLLLLFSRNPYQHSVFLTSASTVGSTVHECVASVTDYFDLKDINHDLEGRNAALEMEVIALREQLNAMQMEYGKNAQIQAAVRKYETIGAHVISNSLSAPNNYITINRGSAEGLEPEMGVVDHNGVVGVVNVVGRHAARVISLLNPDMKLSCKLRATDYFGTMTWDGHDPEHAVLKELPKHGEYNVGDTVITSGYSAIFPEGIIVGTVEKKIKNTDSFASLVVKLATNFSQLSDVRVIKNPARAEMKELDRLQEEQSNKKQAGKQSGKK